MPVLEGKERARRGEIPSQAARAECKTSINGLQITVVQGPSGFLGRLMLVNAENYIHVFCWFLSSIFIQNKNWVLRDFNSCSEKPGLSSDIPQSLSVHSCGQHPSHSQ
ncbi:Zinc Finger Protein Pegasus [Manis pentadactyla]|nr:Zinc Finger Protein Pegasus [Manis pentadactyla]